MTQDIRNFFERQLEAWPLAFQNYRSLDLVKQRSFNINGYECLVQFNPARAVSTLAKVDQTSIRERKCFLCGEYRPSEQMSFDIMPGYELLVNPFPILPYHFTISNKSHIPQTFDLETAMHLASSLEGMTVFFNADGAGASAPDHLHYQAVPTNLLPLVKLIDSDYSNINELKLPFKVTCSPESKYPFNAFVWKDRYFFVPRRAHRPRQYYLETPERRAFSPGALDMAGILVTPFEEDFERVTTEDIIQIYSQVAFDGGRS